MSDSPPDLLAASSLIHWTKSAGLANRLRSLAGYYVLAEILGLDLYVCWEADPGCQAQFEGLFDVGACDLTLEQLVNVDEKNRIAESRKVVVRQGVDWYDKIWSRHRDKVGPWSTFRDRATKFLRSLQPVPAIYDRIEAFSERHSLSNLPGIHVRWSDNLDVYDYFEENATHFKRENVSTLGGFVKFIEGYKDTDNFFFATDNRRVHDALRLLFENQLIEPSREYIQKQSISRRVMMKLASFVGVRDHVDNRRSTSLDEAVIDMWLLSRCDFIVGTYYSSFSEVSAILGDLDYFDVQEVDLVRNELVDWLRGERATSPRKNFPV